MDQALQFGLIIIARLLIWGTMILFVIDFALSMRRSVMSVRRLHSIPCANCCYATGDYRLKCSVHPTSAFSEEAIHCRDFAPSEATYQPATYR